MPIAEAKVSAMDRGFLFGDGAYEVIPVYSRRPFRLAEHLRRLRHARRHPPGQSARRNGMDAADRRDRRAQRRRGPVGLPADHARRRHEAQPRLPGTGDADGVHHVRAAGHPAAGAARARASRRVGARRALAALRPEDDSLLANCLLRQLAVDAGCVETILFRDGCMTEGAASNIFAVKNGVLLAPPKNHLMLPGITYDVVLELAAAWPAGEVRDVLEARRVPPTNCG
jgi:D-alanine transaminase